MPRQQGALPYPEGPRAPPMTGPRHCENSQRAKEKRSVNILPEHQPRDTHGCEPFEVQEKRRRRRIRPNQSKHEQQRADHAAKEDCGCQPWHIRPTERSFWCGQTDSRAAETDECEPYARPKIKQAREELRVDLAEQEFGEWRGCAERMAEANAIGTPGQGKSGQYSAFEETITLCVASMKRWPLSADSKQSEGF